MEELKYSSLLFCFLVVCVTLLPSKNNLYITFENDTGICTFNCSGNGSEVVWKVDGYGVGTSYVLNKGIFPLNLKTALDQSSVTAQLMVPTNKYNNNISVVCTVLDASYDHQSTDPVVLLIQGSLLSSVK